MSELDDFINSLDVSNVDSGILDATEEEISEDEQEKLDSIDSELDDFFKRNNLDPNANTDISDSLVPLPGGNIAVDVTEETQRTAPETADYLGLYGEPPNKAPFTDRVSAFVGDTVDTVVETFGGENIPSASQEVRDDANEEREQFFSNAETFFQTLPTNPDGVRVYRRIDNNGNLEEIKVPHPKSNSFHRIIEQTASNINQSIRALAEGKITSESEYEKRTPDYEQFGAEGLATDILTFGFPGVAAERATVKTINLGRDILRMGPASSKLGRAFKYAAGVSIAPAFSDAVMTGSEDTGFVSPQYIKDTFKIKDDETAKDLAMLLDGMALNGLFDSLFYAAGKLKDYGRSKKEGLKSYFDPEFVKDASRRAAVIETMKLIDPNLEGASPANLAKNLREMAAVMSANSEQLLKIGETTGKIPLDSVNALRRGAADYIRSSRQHLQNTMSPKEWEDYVTKEAVEMTSRMQGVVKGFEDSSMIRDAQANMIDSVDKTIEQAAKDILPEGETARTAAQELVDNRNVRLGEAKEELTSANQAVADVQRQVDNVVSDDPWVQTLLSEEDPTRLFSDETFVPELKELLGNMYSKYKKDWEQVQVNYKSIPNADIDLPAFKSALTDVFNVTGPLGELNDTSRRIMTTIEGTFKDKIQKRTDNLVLADPREVKNAGDVATPQQLIDSISPEVGFADLYELKKNLDDLVTELGSNTPAGRAVMELRKHIIDGQNGQLAFVKNGGDEAAAELAEAADRAFIQYSSDWTNSPQMKRFSDKAAVLRSKGENTAVPEGRRPRGEDDLVATSINEIFPSIVADKSGAYLNTLKNTMDEVLLVGDVDAALTKQFVAQSTRNLALALKSGDTQKVDQILSSFRSFESELTRLEAPEVQEIRDAINRIQRAQEELGSSKLAADTLAEEASARLKAIENEQLANFTSDVFPELAKSGPNIVIKDILNGDDVGNRIAKLMSEVDNLPPERAVIVKKALQSTIADQVRFKIFGSTPEGFVPGSAGEVAVSRNVKMGQLRNITSEKASDIMSGLRAAFSDNPEFLNGMEMALGSLSELADTGRIKASLVGSDTNAKLQTRDSISTAILFTLGYMNPTAAAARRLAADTISKIEKASQKEMLNTIGLMLSAPEEFARLAKAIARNEDPSNLDLLKRAFFDVAIHYSKYELRVGPETEQDQSMRNIFGSAVDKVFGMLPIIGN